MKYPFFTLLLLWSLLSCSTLAQNSIQILNVRILPMNSMGELNMDLNITIQDMEDASSHEELSSVIKKEKKHFTIRVPTDKVYKVTAFDNDNNKVSDVIVSTVDKHSSEPYHIMMHLP